MSYSGKATYSAGATLPELAEDVSDVIGLISPFETPLLDALGDADIVARSTVHEWVEDSLLPNTDQINDSTYTNALTDTTFVVDDGTKFRAGDLIKLEAAGCHEVMLVTGVSTNTLTVVRGYGGTTAFALADNLPVNILSNLTIEGADASAARFRNRTRKINYTQIFAATVEVSGTMQAVNAVGVNRDELQYQKLNRMRELLRDLENAVINSAAPAANPEGSASVRRSMKGIIPQLATHVFTPGSGGFPAGTALTEAQLNYALRAIWQGASQGPDLIVCNGLQKRAINSFISQSSRFYNPSDRRLSEMVGVYESDFGVCRVVLTRWCPLDSVILLNSRKVKVLPLAGRSFQFHRLGRVGDALPGQVVGEYTLELKNENSHGHIRGFATS